MIKKINTPKKISCIILIFCNALTSFVMLADVHEKDEGDGGILKQH